MSTTGNPISPDNGPNGESDWDILQVALEEMDPDLVWVEGQGWLSPEDAQAARSTTIHP